MPGKQDPEYFPLNFNVRLYDYDEHHGSHYEDGGGSGNGSGGGGRETNRRTRNVSLNEVTIPEIENCEIDEEDEDDSISVQSSDLDVDLDDVDTLVYSIREKLRMDPNYSNTVHSFWSESYSNEDSNQSECSTSSHCSVSRKRIRPSSWKRSQSSHNHSLATIQKHKASSHCHHWLTSKSLSDISQRRRGKSMNPHEDPYHVLQELIESGSLIKEAVRRINTKRISCRVNGTTPTTSHQLGSIMSPNSTTAKIFAFRDENSEISFPTTLPLSAK